MPAYLTGAVPLLIISLFFRTFPPLSLSSFAFLSPDVLGFLSLLLGGIFLADAAKRPAILVCAHGLYCYPASLQSCWLNERLQCELRHSGSGSACRAIYNSSGHLEAMTTNAGAVFVSESQHCFTGRTNIPDSLASLVHSYTPSN